MSEGRHSEDRNPRPARSAAGNYHAWAGLSLGFILLFLWSFPLLPATDLPQHLGIASILWRLIAGDATAASYYAFNPQPTPYYLAYVLLSPCVGLFGAFAGARIALSLLALGWVMTLQLCAREIRAPAVVLAAAPFTFFSTLFYWGFIATQIGVPFFLVALWLLLRYPRTHSRRDLVMGSIAALLATLAHALLFLPTAIVVVAFWLGNRRQHLRAALIMVVAAALPLVPGMLATLVRPHSSVPLVVSYSRPALWLHYLQHHIGPVGQRTSWLAHPLCVAGAAMLGAASIFGGARKPASPSRPSRRARRNKLPPVDIPPPPRSRGRIVLGLALAGLTLAFLLFPRRIDRGPVFLWNMAPRFLVFAEILLWLQVPAWRSRRAARAGAACVVVALGLQAASQWQLWRDFNDAAAPELALVRQLPGRARLQVALRTDQRFHGFWPAFLDHVPLYHLANGGLLVTNLFKLPHLPVVQRCARGDTAGQSAPCAPDYLLTSRIPASAHGPAARLVAERGPYALYSLSLGP